MDITSPEKVFDIPNFNLAFPIRKLDIKSFAK